MYEHPIFDNGDYVRFGKPPYNVFQVCAIYEPTATRDAVLGVTMINGVYTELPANRAVLLPHAQGRAEYERQRAAHRLRKDQFPDPTPLTPAQQRKGQRLTRWFRDLFQRARWRRWH